MGVVLQHELDGGRILRIVEEDKLIFASLFAHNDPPVVSVIISKDHWRHMAKTQREFVLQMHLSHVLTAVQQMIGVAQGLPTITSAETGALPPRPTPVAASTPTLPPDDVSLQNTTKLPPRPKFTREFPQELAEQIRAITPTAEAGFHFVDRSPVVDEFGNVLPKERTG